MSVDTAVILAAGRGRRMGALGDHYPKALLPVGNKPLIVHHLCFLQSLGIREVYIVVGYRAADLISTLGTGEQVGVRVHYVEQTKALGSAHALAQLRPDIQTPFLLLLGDYYFATSRPDRLIRRLNGSSDGMAIAAKRESDRKALAEACALQVDNTGRVLDIVEKPTAPTGNIKGCGVYALRPAFFDAVTRTPRTALRDEYELSVALELYVKAGNPLYAEEIIDWDMNVTRPDDLLACNLRLLDEQGRQQLVAAGAEVDEGICLDRVVVGDRVRITGISRLKEVVVFPGVWLDGGGDLERGLIVPQRFIPCPTVEVKPFQSA